MRGTKTKFGGSESAVERDGAKLSKFLAKNLRCRRIVFVKPEIFEKRGFSVVRFSGMTGFDNESTRLMREAELG